MEPNHPWLTWNAKHALLNRSHPGDDWFAGLEVLHQFNEDSAIHWEIGGLQSSEGHPTESHNPTIATVHGIFTVRHVLLLLFLLNGLIRKQLSEEELNVASLTSHESLYIFISPDVWVAKTWDHNGNSGKLRDLHGLALHHLNTVTLLISKLDRAVCNPEMPRIQWNT